MPNLLNCFVTLLAVFCVVGAAGGFRRTATRTLRTADADADADGAVRTGRLPLVKEGLDRRPCP